MSVLVVLVLKLLLRLCGVNGYLPRSGCSTSSFHSGFPIDAPTSFLALSFLSLLACKNFVFPLSN
jgi:hypothetical protein